jgi:hypothetical protein
MENVNPVQVQKHLKGIDYPADKNKLIEVAKSEGADDNVLSTLEKLPDGEQFQSAADVSKSLGQIM